MSTLYPIVVTENGEAVCYTSWFVNSYDALDVETLLSLDETYAEYAKRMLRLYETTYNVRIVKKTGMVDHIEFPTKDYAIMFIMRWS